jgi:hypothetical protein
MIVEALRSADDHILIPGRPTEDELKVQKYENGIAMRKMSECAKDFHAYWRLTEYVLRMIEHSVDPVSSSFCSFCLPLIDLLALLLEIATSERYYMAYSNAFFVSIYWRNYCHK